ncbi:DUF4276 family protein [Acinetobacter baumannii]|uniref:DUF4276 family protein n=1 Tax=Acinetobacter baumannii TaxID=470 RepID=UPI0004F544B4|nr:DUF4276 family protein [Acinetobacter baumannii]AJB67577.1 hypothetical protein RU84_12055 [Acinetobacter baumannii]EHU1392168.1 DUF4276 family protein [Acinetobacter baumannii]EHU2509375.1 DUF4276 family protein [Acinetobacter baumannii]EKU5044640.1 DUF4276 family protein [Acinetobacter baumannii]KQD42191.1 hypothetical protein APD15_05065 [Acinetobacter baumannii]
MVRVHIICEGQTEETFINEVLMPEFSKKDIYLYPALIGRPGHKGGNVKYSRMKTDIENRLNDKEAYCTTFFDFYGLDSNFPGKEIALRHNSLSSKKQILEDQFVQKLIHDIGENHLRRFIPYVQMYEFEGLLFSDSEAIASNLGINLASVERILTEFDTPEHINNSPQTAPSKRLQALSSSYDKVFLGSLIALDVGIAKMREKCAGFDNWLTQIEQLTPI